MLRGSSTSVLRVLRRTTRVLLLRRRTVGRLGTAVAGGRSLLLIVCTMLRGALAVWRLVLVLAVSVVLLLILLRLRGLLLNVSTQLHNINSDIRLTPDPEAP